MQATTSHLEGVWQWGGEGWMGQEGQGGLYTPDYALPQSTGEKLCVLCIAMFGMKSQTFTQAFKPAHLQKQCNVGRGFPEGLT